MGALAQVGHRTGELVVVAMLETVDGYWIPNVEWHRVLPDAVDDTGLGAAVRSAWGQSRTDEPNPVGNDFADELGRRLGAADYASYSDTITLVDVESDDGAVYVTPYASETDGFAPLNDEESTHGELSDAALGAAVRAGLARST